MSNESLISITFQYLNHYITSNKIITYEVRQIDQRCLCRISIHPHSTRIYCHTAITFSFVLDLPRKKVLETFKQLVSTNKLQFTAGNLFRVNYHLIIGTVMNVITYSIICIQLLLRTD